MRTSIILSRGASGYMVLQDKKSYYFSSVNEVAKLIAELIEPKTENDLVMISIQTLKRKETSKEQPNGQTEVIK